MWKRETFCLCTANNYQLSAVPIWLVKTSVVLNKTPQIPRAHTPNPVIFLRIFFAVFTFIQIDWMFKARWVINLKNFRKQLTVLRLLKMLHGCFHHSTVWRHYDWSVFSFTLSLVYVYMSSLEYLLVVTITSQKAWSQAWKEYLYVLLTTARKFIVECYLSFYVLTL